MHLSLYAETVCFLMVQAWSRIGRHSDGLRLMKSPAICSVFHKNFYIIFKSNYFDFLKNICKIFHLHLAFFLSASIYAEVGTGNGKKWATTHRDNPQPTPVIRQPTLDEQEQRTITQQRQDTCQYGQPLTSNGNDLETKAERSFDLDFVFGIKANEPAYSRTCIDQSEANPAYSTP